jgi:uncharacterized protein YcaQ
LGELAEQAPSLACYHRVMMQDRNSPATPGDNGAAGATPSLSWAQALAWRLQRHHLAARVAPTDLVRVVGDICGLHAQLMSSAELSLWARIDGLDRRAVQEALWQHRALVKLWAMRGTLHLLPAAELGLWLAALGTITNRGMTGHPEIDALAEAVGRALDGRLLTREELARTVERLSGRPEFGTWVRFSWGSYLKAASFRGQLCFAASERGRVQFTTPTTWLPGPLATPDPAEALRAVTRRFMQAYAPATAADLALWWGGFGPARGRRMLAALGAEAVEVALEGDRAWVLAQDVAALTHTEPGNVAHLLPAFDPWVVGAARTNPALLDPEHKARVYRPQGWISPVVLMNGRMVGVWRQTRQGRRVTVGIEPFAPLPAWAKAQVTGEAARLAAFLGGDLALQWGASAGSSPP